MSTPSPGIGRPLIAVVVATHNRTVLLRDRSLPSIAAQTQPPDLVILVDDSDEEYRAGNEEALRTLRLPSERLIYLRNYRTSGASGAWNTALDWLDRNHFNAHDVYAAFLDDDDAWEPRHLAECATAAIAGDLDVVASGILRIDHATHEQRPPDALRVDDFLAGNPHIQGSNLFARLDVLLKAGTFDEDLTNCTDRDLCIRLCDLWHVRYGPSPAVTVLHYADAHRPRMSNRSSGDLDLGRTRFWFKYSGRMKPDVKAAFLDRAQRLFGWTPPAAPAPCEPNVPPSKPFEIPFSLVAAVATDSPVRIRPLLEQLCSIGLRASGGGLDVLVLANGEGALEAALSALVGEMRERGLRCYLLPRAMQVEDARRGLFGPDFLVPSGPAGIGTSRTMLQAYAHDFARRRTGAVVWVLDDDLRPDLAEHYLAKLPELREAGVDVVLGSFAGAPPLPAASCIRVQLVDLVHNLHWLDGLPQDEPFPDRSGENAHLRAKYRDYYYDLSRKDTGQLEAPFFLEPAVPGETARQARARLVKSAVRILAGDQVTRPLPAVLARDPVKEAVDSVERGGNTFVLNLEALRDVPNLVPHLNGRETRRSDMIWCILQRHRHGRRIVQLNFPLRQDRSDLVPDRLGVEKLVADIEGYALRTALAEVLHADRGHHDEQARDRSLRFSEEEIEHACERAAKYREERLRAFALSFRRIQGLAAALRRLDVGGELAPLLDALDRDYTSENLALIRNGVRDLTPEAVREFLSGLEERVSRFRSATGTTAEFEPQRVEIARHQIRRLCRPLTDLRLLGCGSEAVVMTDGKTVFKYFDYWKAAKSARSRDFLRSLVGAPAGGSLYPVTAVREEGVHFLLEYPFEESDPYRGGHGPGLVALLQECRRRGIACRNIHPDNLRVVGERVVLVDYGSDLCPLTDGEFLHMCRRAWLSWRWHFRPDLKALMTRALKDSSMPELDGFERFLEAVEGPDAWEKQASRLADLVLSLSPHSVVDHGCGKGELVARLRREGVLAFGFDPDKSLAAAAWSKEDQGSWCANDLAVARTSGPFEVVVSELVLCAILEDEEYTRVLKELRSLVAEDGTVLIEVCDPFFTHGGPTALQHRSVPDGATYERSFTWTKRVHLGGDQWSTRQDRHRPLDRLRRDLLRSGLEVTSVEPVRSVDLDRFDPVSEFLILTARPVPTPTATVSLLIKTCAMEWQTIRDQVAHLVRQLEGPRAFTERVVVVDSRTEGFVRQYAPSDLPRLLEELDVLRAEGIIDRVVLPTDVESLMARWVGVRTGTTHSKDGAPLAPFFAGIEACRGEYVLQVDADMLVGRDASRSDYLSSMVALLRDDPKGLTAAMPIPRSTPLPWTWEDRWRVEVRASLFHRERLLSCRPLPMDVVEGVPAASWHRALDQIVRDGLWRSYRGGGDGAFVIHPDNSRKTDLHGWMAVLDAVERGVVPASQQGHIELGSATGEWLLPRRGEKFVFVVCGRDVAPGRAQRCLDSIRRQEGDDWGLVVVDDGSSPRSSEYLALAMQEFDGRSTLVRTRRRRGLLANLVWTVRHVCIDPESVVVMVDLDDSLLGDRVVSRLREAYARGADATVGSMLRTDKGASYPVDFEDPVRGNVWQHLKSFRKRVFDRIPDSLLQLDGEYVDLANDWAYMLAVVHLSRAREWVREPLYLHEPSGTGKGREQERREDQVRRIVGQFRRWVHDGGG